MMGLIISDLADYAMKKSLYGNQTRDERQQSAIDMVTTGESFFKDMGDSMGSYDNSDNPWMKGWAKTSKKISKGLGFFKKFIDKPKNSCEMKK